MAPELCFHTPVLPVTDGNLTLGIWSGEFDCDPADEASLEAIVGDAIYRDGMRGLNSYLANIQE